MRSVHKSIVLLALFALIGVAARAGDEPYKPGKEIRLFNGRDLRGWVWFSEDKNARMQDVWQVDTKEKVLICKGAPTGYLRTEKTFGDYVLKLQWRFSPVTKKAGNSGVLLRTNAPEKIWPTSVEAQLMSEHAGDFWIIGDAKLASSESARNNPRYRQARRMNEKPVGEWNEYEILCLGDKITLKVNGETLNESAGAEPREGWIGFQSEGAEIHFRNIRLQPITMTR